jgi:hypothetical protein
MARGANNRYNAARDANEPEIIQALKAKGAIVWKINGKGLPDLLVGYKSITILAEVKTAKGKFKPAQEVFFDTWSGGKACVIKTIEEAIALLDSIDASLEPVKL